MLTGKTLFDFTNLFSSNDYKKNNKIIYKCFKDKYSKPLLKIKKIDETRNFLLEEVKHNELMSENH